MADVKIFARTIDDSALKQIETLSEYGAYKDSVIRIMPDAHAGAGCTIGTTMTLHGKVTANLTGVDISCGMLVVNLGKRDIDCPKLDKLIRTHIPSGFNTHSSPVCFARDFDKLRCKIDTSRADVSLGSLGGGNHFIEVNESESGEKYLVIHTGSRNMGVQVCTYYQKLAYEKLTDCSKEREEIIYRLKAEGRERDIMSEIAKIPYPKVNRTLAHLEGEDFEDYIHDMRILQTYAYDNRATIAKIITEGMGWKEAYRFETLHNYIDIDNMILRKGAVSARRGEMLIIPMNMRDGSLICVGKGNPDWNYSAPHGAGRLMSRDKAKETLDMDEFKKSMEGVYTTSVCKETIDEAPMAYKPMQERIECIEPTVEVKEIIKPIYNFKAS